MPGLIHIYCGDGKGKTTAAVGLAIRAAGAKQKVLFTQFFKCGDSSEISVLKQLDSITVHVCTTRHGFFKNMNAEQRAKATADYTNLFADIIKQAENGIGLLVLDEVISASNYGVVPMERLIDFLKNKPAELEVVLTGRNPADELLALADYVTEMKKIKHPFDRSIMARKGIEF